MKPQPLILRADSRRLRREFVMLPYRLYRGDPCWVPPLVGEEKKFLQPRHNPFLRGNEVELFLCRRGNETVGRIAAVLNRDHQRHHNDRCGFFGMFECVNDPLVAERLLGAAGDWLRERGVDTLRGPASFSLNSVAGLLIDGFDLPPAVMMAYNPPYYRQLFAGLGLREVMKFFAYEVSRDTIRFPRAAERLEGRLRDEGIRFRSFDLQHAERDMATLIDLFNRAWADNWGFVPTTLEEGLDDLKKMRPVIRPDLILLAEKNGSAVGFSLSLPDINQALRPLNGRLFPLNWLRLLRNLRRIDRIRVTLMGVLQEYRHLGIDLVFYKMTSANAKRYGIHKAEMSWILESNEAMNRVLRHINARITKTYAIFEKGLGNG
ncbi:MAG: N-acetyltransferase [Candidatus Aminicenantes bacterium]|nr:N-acetyltransferase [Candidatus Aminicenantes bacterium]